jgi:putative flippase GtrA
LLIERIYQVMPKPLARLLTRACFGQLVRFAVGGLGVTLLAALIYLFAAYAVGLTPLAANAVSHSVGLIASYTVHSRWSFSDRQDSEEVRMIVRFCTVSAIAFAMNSFWVALTTGLLMMPAFAPVPLMIFVTPLVSFTLNRYWVFRASGRGAAAPAS